MSTKELVNLYIDICDQILVDNNLNQNNKYLFFSSIEQSIDQFAINLHTELNLNIGQGLSYDVWRQSAQSDCFFSGGSLPSLYPNSGGTWDSTNPRWNAKLHDFKTFKCYESVVPKLRKVFPMQELLEDGSAD